MAATNNPSKGIESFKVIKPDNLVNDIVQYIETQLPMFISSDEFRNVIQTKKNENQHTTAFCLYMTNKCQSRFNFNSQSSQKGSRTVDIGVYYGANLVFTIEAKILPTPKGNSNRRRDEHEYVYGNGAGIQRFKDGYHGVNDSGNILPINGMIAYVKEKSFTYWHTQINQWISDASWPDTELLQKVYFHIAAKLISKHTRDDHSALTLHHFWVSV